MHWTEVLDPALATCVKVTSSHSVNADVRRGLASSMYRTNYKTRYICIVLLLASIQFLLCALGVAYCDSELNGLLLLIPVALSWVAQRKIRGTFFVAATLNFWIGILWGFIFGTMYAYCYTLIRPDRFSWPDNRLERPLFFGACVLEMMAIIGIASSPCFAMICRLVQRWVARKGSGESIYLARQRSASLAWLTRLATSFTAMVILIGLLTFLFDFTRVRHLRNQSNRLVGTDIATVRAMIGEPSFTFEQGDGTIRWLYCSRFDWDGVRSRWNDSPYLLYWYTRLDLETDSDHDAVIELVFVNDRLDTIANSVRDDLIGRYPVLSF